MCYPYQVHMAYYIGLQGDRMREYVSCNVFCCFPSKKWKKARGSGQNLGLGPCLGLWSLKQVKIQKTNSFFKTNFKGHSFKNSDLPTFIRNPDWKSCIELSSVFVLSEARTMPRLQYYPFQYNAKNMQNRLLIPANTCVDLCWFSYLHLNSMQNSISQAVWDQKSSFDLWYRS